MSKHTCSEKCFSRYNKYINAKISEKLRAYKHTDTRVRRNEGTISQEDAYALLLYTKGICEDCGRQCILHGWEFKDKKQFSFDRLDDDESHNKDNLRITCLECNVKKADEMYKPDMKYLRDYSYLRNEYWFLVSMAKSCSVVHVKQIDDYIVKLGYACAHYHYLTYGNRRTHRWERTLFTDNLVKPNRDYKNYWYAQIGSYFSDEI